MHELAVTRDEKQLAKAGIDEAGDGIRGSSSSSTSACQDMEGAPSSACYTVELCAGSAGLSLSLSEAGFSTVTVDHGKNSHKPKSPCVNLDLSLDSGWTALYALLESDKLLYVHGAPPCGTASRAREKPVSARQVALGAPNPPPLRSDDFPEGLPGLAGINLARVQSANALYRRMAKFLAACCEKGLARSVENPTRSLMWLTSWFAELLGRSDVQEVRFQQCMHGGTRPKWSSWYTNCSQLSRLAMVCDESHEHEQFGLRKNDGKWCFDTAKEAEYPRELCVSVAAAVLELANSKGISLVGPASAAVPIPCPATTSATASLRAASGRQPRGKKFPEMVPEFNETVKLDFAAEVWQAMNLAPGDKLSASAAAALGLAFEAKVKDVDINLGSSRVSVLFGIFHTCEQFVSKAVLLEHPFDGSLR